jgi:hypothetical protein
MPPLGHFALIRFRKKSTPDTADIPADVQRAADAADLRSSSAA